MKRKFSPYAKYGSWTVLTSAGRSDKGDLLWTCRCDCGVERVVLQRSLLAGVSAGCGCATRFIKGNTSPNSRHLESKVTTEYRAWCHMRNRCNNPANKSYRHYGGRGIKVCDRWTSFENFLADMGRRPAAHTLERDDVNGNYEPGNCRWATAKEQQNNRRNNRYVILGGVRMSFHAACDVLGIDYHLVWRRACLHNWPLHDAMTRPRRANAGTAGPLSRNLSQQHLNAAAAGIALA